MTEGDEEADATRDSSSCELLDDTPAEVRRVSGLFEVAKHHGHLSGCAILFMIISLTLTILLALQSGD